MQILSDQVKRAGSIGLEVILGLFLLGLVVAAWKGSGTSASAARVSPAAANKAAGIREPLLAVQGTPCVTPPPNMISWWTADGTADDLQDGNDGTLVNGATFATGMVAQAFSLDGVNDRVDVPDADNLDIPSQITIDAWIRPNALGGTIVNKSTDGKPDGYVLDTFGGNVRFIFGSQSLSGSTTLQTGVFTHVAATYDFSTLNVYVNGVLDGTLSAEELIALPNNVPLRIGANQVGGSLFNGLIDEVEIFDRALSAQEIQSIVDAGSSGKCKNNCVLNCPSDIFQSNDKGQCGALVTYAPTSSACGGVTCSPPSGTFFPVGSASVTCTSDAGPACSFNVTVNDTGPPVFNSCPGTINASTSDKCEVINYPTPSATDDCGKATVSCVPPSGSCFPVGTTTVVCTAADGSKTSPDAECIFEVIVDACPIACPANILTANDMGQCGAVVSFAATAPKACGAVTCSPASASFFPVGTTTVACASVGGGSCSFTVQVTDTQAPTITCPASVIAVGSIVTYPAPTVSDNCPGATATCSPASGSTFPAGTTTVTCTATDASGNTAGCSFAVTSFDVCLQDDSSANRVLLFSSTTGDYMFCCGQFTLSGRGTVIKQGGNITLQHSSVDRRVLGKFSTTSKSGSGSLQSPPGVTRCTIADRDTRNNTCSCTL
jgi:Concanavalin A-like lectin/glucanases superfamily/HYR domain